MIRNIRSNVKKTERLLKKYEASRDELWAMKDDLEANLASLGDIEIKDTEEDFMLEETIRELLQRLDNEGGI
jgi:hypothetical protein